MPCDGAIPAGAPALSDCQTRDGVPVPATTVPRAALFAGRLVLVTANGAPLTWRISLSLTNWVAEHVKLTSHFEMCPGKGFAEAVHYPCPDRVSTFRGWFQLSTSCRLVALVQVAMG